MTDLSRTIAPKSDQLNADDLIGRSRTITVTRVTEMSSEDQPIAIHFEGDGGKPYKPCLSMRRVLVQAWGMDGKAYAGRRMTLFRDDKVQFGGMAVGGIRISHVSGIDGRMTMALTVTRARRVAYTVLPLPDDRGSNGRGAEPDSSRPQTGRDRLFAAARAAADQGPAALQQFRDGLTDQQDDGLKPILDELRERADAADRPDAPPADPAGDFPGNDAIRGAA